MNEIKTWVIFLLLSISLTANSKIQSLKDDKQLQLNERFGMKSPTVLKTVVKNGGFPDAISVASGIGKLATIDYNGPPAQVVKDVGDAIVPIIAAGLSLIPGVGPIIGGLMSALWGLISPLFGGTKEDPMVKIIKDIYNELNDIKKKINELAGKINELAVTIPQAIRKERDEKLAVFVHKGLHGEFSRNIYICGKYATISKLYSDNLRANKTISEYERMEMITHMQDCDNFLKDTSEAFVYPEYADVLWIPSAIATVMRVSFLSEAANYGYALKLDPSFIRLFWAELKNETKRHFAFYEAGLNNRLVKLIANRKQYQITEYEKVGCRIQKEILFLDRVMYQYGVPKYFQISNNTVLNLADYNVSDSSEPRHIQVIFQEVNKVLGLHHPFLLNCIWGPSIKTVAIPIGKELSFGITYVLNKTYLIRIAYFVPKDILTRDINGPVVNSYNEQLKMSESSNFSDKTVTITEESKNFLKITIEDGKPSNASAQRFVVTTACYGLDCMDEFPECIFEETGYLGAFVLESVAAFDVLSEEECHGKILIESKQEDDLREHAIILGAEIIAVPLLVP